jgi:hypothetical protein
MYLIDKKRLIFLWSPLANGNSYVVHSRFGSEPASHQGTAFMRAVSIATSSRLEALYV